MNVKGPFKDKTKVAKGAAKPWYLSYFAPKLLPDGTIALDAKKRPILQRRRTDYATKAEAEADKPRLETQHAATGTGEYLFDRKAAEDYEQAKKIMGDGVTMVDVAKFWRLHHPLADKKKVESLVNDFLAAIELSHEKKRHWSDLRSRLGMFVKAGFGGRYPDTVTRDEVLNYVTTLKNQDGSKAEARTQRNHKTSICTFFNWLLDKKLITVNPAGGIKKRMLAKEVPKEIEYLTLDYVRRYLRSAERYAPDLVSHEVIQFLSGVRSDDEMDNFKAEFVKSRTKEIVIPASIAKTEKREVIQNVEECFWAWWTAYGPESGLLRPCNYGPKWERLRVLTSIHDQAEADKLGRLPIKTLLAMPVSQKALAEWPWNARRRTFCTYHIAMHQSADKTALILRHRGAASTLHNSYRGLGATVEDGREYFSILPQRVDQSILPEVEAKGIVKIQADQRLDAGQK